jgi:quercetin dioxygenase-like cupin family protein
VHIGEREKRKRAPLFSAFKEEAVMPTGHSRQTSGTTHRAARQMSGRGHVFALTDEVRSLRGELDHSSGGRAAKTLAKTDGLRVTLVLLTSGATLNPESTAGGASLHVLEGRVRVQAEGKQQDLGPRELIVFGENLREPVTAIEDAAFLVTVAWPAGAGASEHEGAEGSG